MLDSRTFENICQRERCKLDRLYVGFLQVNIFTKVLTFSQQFYLALFEFDVYLIDCSKETANYKQQLQSVRIQNASLEQGQRNIQQEMVR